MTAAPTLDGRLRIDAEDEDDWAVLGSIATDADGDPLADRLGRLIRGEAAEDWREYVVPDLADEFEGRVAFVRKEVADALALAGGGPGKLWISRERAFDWYGAINQARLALEERYRFGAEGKAPLNQGGDAVAAYIRSRFYCAIQSMMLDFLMK